MKPAKKKTTFPRAFNLKRMGFILKESLPANEGMMRKNQGWRTGLKKWHDFH